MNTTNVRIPPSVYSVPVYRPGDTVTTYSYASGYSPGSGRFYGSGVAYTTTPGYWSSELRVSPGYDLGAHFPSIAFTLWDPRTKQAIWSGSCNGASYINANLSVTAPFVLLKIFARLPVNEANRRRLLESADGFLNVVTWPLTRDGTVYYPTVIHMPRRCAAKTAGLRLWDIIVEIDGRSTANMRAKTFKDLEEMAVGERLRLKVTRLNRILDVQVPLEPLAPEYRERLRRM